MQMRGKWVGVEVKSSATEGLRKSQMKSFAVLEAIGLRVFVWSGDFPDKLVPWRKYQREASASNGLTRKRPTGKNGVLKLVASKKEIDRAAMCVRVRRRLAE